jgi:hypothetical protein
MKRSDVKRILICRLFPKYSRFTRIGKLDHFGFPGVIKVPPLADFFYGSKTALAKTVTVINTAHPDTWGWDFLFRHIQAPCVLISSMRHGSF